MFWFVWFEPILEFQFELFCNSSIRDVMKSKQKYDSGYIKFDIKDSHFSKKQALNS